MLLDQRGQSRIFSQSYRFAWKYADNGAYAGDNLIVFGRNMSFLHDDKFITAFKNQISEDNTVGYGIMWRLYTFCWAAGACLNKAGAFVECGVSAGSSSSIMCNYLNFEKIDKCLYLYDAWGLDPRVENKYNFNENTFLEVKRRFSSYDNVRLVQGFVPESFELTCPSEISFLHIDLNNAEAEISVLDHLFDKVVPGGIILLDDYGANGFIASKIAEDAWMQERGYKICELPTGQA